MGKNITIGVTDYEGIKKVQLKKTDTEEYADFMDTTDADAVAGDILDGKSGYVNSVKIDGTMENRGAIDEDITAHDDEITILAGYHNGSGKVQIASADQAKLITGNIKKDITLLGVAGKSSVVDTDDANAVAGEISDGKTAYVNGVKLTGTHECEGEGFRPLEIVASSGGTVSNGKFSFKQSVLGGTHGVDAIVTLQDASGDLDLQDYEGLAIQFVQTAGLVTQDPDHDKANVCKYIAEGLADNKILFEGVSSGDKGIKLTFKWWSFIDAYNPWDFDGYLCLTVRIDGTTHAFSVECRIQGDDD